MRLADLVHGAGEWLREGGPMHDVVISSRIRLARNLAGVAFLSRCNAAQRAEIELRLREQILQARPAADMFYVDVAACCEIDRQLLVERHLISRQHALGFEPNAKGGAKRPHLHHARGVAVGGGETLAIMVNEEDHLRLQVLRSGLQLEQAFEDISRADNLLEERLDFAYHARYGYLTACPTNVGTGMRVSVMLHLPALKMTGEIEKVFCAARDMHLAVRGLYGEGTEASGDFFQVSNQTTLGCGERQIVVDFRDRILPAFIEYEKRARASLLAKNRLAVEDKVARSMAILRSARLITSGETMYLLSLIRLGINEGLIDGIDLRTMNELFLLCQPAHLQRILGQELTAQDRSQARAEYIRKRLAAAA